MPGREQDDIPLRDAKAIVKSEPDARDDRSARDEATVRGSRLGEPDTD